jgi:hypothetical protein
VFTGVNIYDILNALVGTKNFTIAIVAKVTSTAVAQAFCAYGAPIGGNGGYVGVDFAGTGLRSFDQSGVNPISDGPATTSWEAWVFTSDTNGNLSLLVNGASQSPSPSSSTANAPSAVFTVGGNNSGTAVLTGNIFEVIVYNTAQSNTAIYSYQHAITGL